MRTIVMANDHGGVEMKQELARRLAAEGHRVINVGVDNHDEVDYPDMAALAAAKVVSGEAEFGILICGTGIGIGMAANKVEGIRAALCSDCFSARMSKEHNDANVITLGARTVGIELAWEMVKSYMAAEFLGGKHAVRVGKIDALYGGTEAAK